MVRILQHSIVVLLLLVSGCVNLRLENRLSVDSQDWYTEGGSETRHHQVATTVDPPLIEKWRFDVGAGVGLAGALVIDEVILVGTRKGHILALDLNTGKRLGRARFEAPIEGGMSFKNSLLYLPFIDKKKTVVAYNVYKGDHVWKVKGAPVESTILADDSIAVVVDSDAFVRGLDASNGDVLWESAVGDRTGIVASPVSFGDSLIVATENGVVHMIEWHSGRGLWEVALPEAIYSTPAVSSESVFMPTTRGRVYSLSADSGEIEWMYSLADSTVRFASPGYDSEAGQLVLAGSDGHVRSLDSVTGNEQWVTALDGAIIIAPLFTNNTIYIGTLRGKLYALDRITGDKIWEHKLTGRIKSAMAAYDGRIVVMAETQQLFVFETETKDELSP